MRSTLDISPRSLPVALAIALAPLQAIACSVTGPDFVEVTPRDALPGEAAPAAPRIEVVGIRRGSGDEPVTSCSDIGMLSLALRDEPGSAAPAYELKLLEGDSGALAIPPNPMRPRLAEDGGHYFVISWIDDASNDQEPLALKVRVTALSSTGARGGSVVVDIADPGR